MSTLVLWEIRCCAPYHLGAAEADTPTALMRSRFAAFARADVDYVYRTLHPDHPERAAPEAAARRALAEGARAHRYMGLTILDARGPDADGVAQAGVSRLAAPQARLAQVRAIELARAQIGAAHSL